MPDSRILKIFNTCDDDGFASWSNLNHDLLFLIMKQVGFFDFIALSGVCKQWRSVAVSNWNKFMKTKQPMRLSISTRVFKTDYYLEDYTRRKLKTIIPHSNGRKCVGITCGYLIFFGRKTCDFWLVNPFTRKQLHFPGVPFAEITFLTNFSGILVFSPSLSGWVFVVLESFYARISFSLAGKQARWRCISSNSPISDLHFFKGKLYMINILNQLWELRLNPEPTLTLQKMKNLPCPNLKVQAFVSSGENLYVRDIVRDVFNEVDFEEMKWGDSERTIGGYAVFVSDFYKCNAAIKPDTWTQHERLDYFQNNKSCRFLTREMWYFLHDCLNDNDPDMENGGLMNILKD